MDGQIFEGRDKHFFPICYVNPLKKDELKTKINNYVDSKLIEYKDIDSEAKMLDESFLERNKGFLKFYFKDRLAKSTDYEIVAIKKEDKNVYHILLEAIDDPDIKCVVELDEEFENVLFIYF